MEADYYLLLFLLYGLEFIFFFVEEKQGASLAVWLMKIIARKVFVMAQQIRDSKVCACLWTYGD